MAAVTPAEVDALRRRFPVRLPNDGDVGTSADARRYQMAKCPTWWLDDGRYVSEPMAGQTPALRMLA